MILLLLAYFSFESTKQLLSSSKLENVFFFIKTLISTHTINKTLNLFRNRSALEKKKKKFLENIAHRNQQVVQRIFVYFYLFWNPSETSITQYSGIIYQNINTTEIIQRRFYYLFAFSNGIIVGNSNTSCKMNFSCCCFNIRRLWTL